MGHGTPEEPGADGTRTFAHDDRAAIALLHERDWLREQNAELVAALKRCADKLHAQDVREGLPHSAELQQAEAAIAKVEKGA